MSSCRECARVSVPVSNHGSNDMSGPQPDTSLVDGVLGTQGQPLPQSDRAFMEQRFGRDFSAVRVHADAAAAESAEAIRAQAYTAGQHIVLGADAAAARGEASRRILAHELAHTVQQRHVSQPVARLIGDANGAAEREADVAADRVMHGSSMPVLRPSSSPALQRLPLPRDPLPTSPMTRTRPAAPPVAAPPQFPARGTNPGDCAETACSAATRAPVPTSDADAAARVDAWEQQALACLRSGAAASNASHQADIVANEETEIAAAADRLRTVTLPGLGRGARRYDDFLASVRETCMRKSAEIGIEFRYNVVFDTPANASSRWGFGDSSWDNVERALSALPASATWGNPRLIRFHRAACHPRDLDASGKCVGQGSGPVSSFIGGETSGPNKASADIDVFDAGVGARPYSRSASLGIAATDQTIRHEVGHVIDIDIPRTERERFFRDIVRWEEFSWAWVNSPKPRIATWQQERDRLGAVLGFDETRLDAWLPTLQPAVPVTANGFTCTRDANGTGGSTLFLSIVDATRLPGGAEFEYARSGQGEYIAELYALAVSRPGYLHDVLRADQIEWLKRFVFKTPATPHEWARVLAARDRSGNANLLARLMRVFTWEQVEQVFNDQPLAGGARRA